MNAPIYLDYNATTPVAPEVADAMAPFLREAFGNPSSSHRYGRRAHEAVENARENVAALIGARAGEFVFTGCAAYYVVIHKSLMVALDTTTSSQATETPSVVFPS